MSSATNQVLSYGLSFVPPDVALAFYERHSVKAPLNLRTSFGHVQFGTIHDVLDPSHLLSCTSVHISCHDAFDDEFITPTMHIDALAITPDCPVCPWRLESHLIEAIRRYAAHSGVTMVMCAHRLRSVAHWHLMETGIYVSTVEAPSVHLPMQDGREGEAVQWSLNTAGGVRL